MNLYLIRHGIAAERGTYEKDEERPLTKKGIKRTRRMAQRLADIGLKLDVVLTSPLIRAEQTAQILHKAGLTTKVESCTPLAPGGDVKGWLDWYSGWVKEKPGSQVALVGHQPDLGNWAEILVWGNCDEKMVVKKAGTIGVSLPEEENPMGKGELFLLTSPKWLL